MKWLLISFLFVSCVSNQKKTKTEIYENLTYDLFVKNGSDFAFQEKISVLRFTKEAVYLPKDKEEISMNKGFILQRKEITYPEEVIKGKDLVEFSCSFDKYSDEIFYGKDFIKIKEEGILIVFYNPSNKLEFSVSNLDCKF